MTREEAIEKLKQLKAKGDLEMAHPEADNVLCSLLVTLGYQDVVDAWDEIGKWYA